VRPQDRRKGEFGDRAWPKDEGNASSDPASARSTSGFRSLTSGNPNSTSWRSVEKKEPTMPNRSIKDEKTYQKVRDQGASKEKAARIANASAKEGHKRVSKRGGRSSSYQDMSKQELYERAKKVGIAGRSSMTKAELTKALRDH
jgi:hypothetical protein